MRRIDMRRDVVFGDTNLSMVLAAMVEDLLRHTRR